ncbi:MAG: GPR endopeptidase [Ruminococcaceae bacterium]|nr:GPR endopeptidase [Oscillospiraceae bacterium]
MAESDQRKERKIVMNSTYGSGSCLSDLALERRRADLSVPGVDMRCDTQGSFRWERLHISTREGADSIGRPIGFYDTLTMPRVDTLDEDDTMDAANEVAKELCLAMDRLDVIPDRLLIVGLGNRELTPDSIGPRTADMINATMHIKRMDKKTFSDLECSELAVCTPGVMGQSGMEAIDTVLGICDRIGPDAVIAIDALASRSAERLGTTVQISDTGIFPGSGIGNNRSPITEGVLGIPVIAIGIPTVISARMLIPNADASVHQCLGDMFVSPREIDAIADSAAKIISTGINQAFGIF